MRGFLLGVMTVVVAGLIVGYVLLKSGLVPANADAQPGRIELWVAGTSLNSTIAREAPKGPNPVTLTDAHLIQGVKLYGQHCAICHGSATGDVSASPIAKGEYPKPPQFGTDGIEDDADGVTYWKIKHGIRLTGMPSWNGSLKDEQIWSLALFLKNMDKLSPGAQAEWSQVKN
jgi:thiosulfate dehydrogenase